MRFNQAPLNPKVAPPIVGCVLTPARNRSVEVRQKQQNPQLRMHINNSSINIKANANASTSASASASTNGINGNLFNRYGTNAISPTQLNKLFY